MLTRIYMINGETKTVNRCLMIRFGDYLEQVGIPGLTAVCLQTEPDACRGLSWSIFDSPVIFVPTYATSP
jgi:hypothetical protein